MKKHALKGDNYGYNFCELNIIDHSTKKIVKSIIPVDYIRDMSERVRGQKNKSVVEISFIDGRNVVVVEETLRDVKEIIKKGVFDFK